MLTASEMSKGYVMDEWDRKLILSLKGRGGYAEAVTLFGERCGMEEHFVRTGDVVRWLLKMVVGLGLARPEELLDNAAPESQWKYGYGAPETYWGFWFNALASTLRNTEVRRLPGLLPERGE